MTEDDKEALIVILRGGAVMGIILGAIILGIAAILSQNNTPIDQPSFEVVDTYKGCDIVRYAPHQVAEYKYFLYCENNK